jgi:protein translocase SecG subunit
MNLIIFIIHIIIAVLLICAILLQTGQGGLGFAFGGGEHFRSKRGAEKMLFGATIVLSVLFLLTSIITLVIK